MSWRFTGKARVDPEAPRAFGVCDRCGFWYNLETLQYQHDWRGPRLINLHRRVCDKCLDQPFPFYRPVILPPDPEPAHDPRPENFAADDAGQGGNTFTLDRSPLGGGNPLG